METIVACLIAFFVSIAVFPWLIPLLHRFKFGQQIRDDGPQAHLKKSGTPTMGGIGILIAAFFGSLPYMIKYPLIIPIFLFSAAFGLIGFLDDSLKIRKKKSEGLKARQKFLLQIIFTSLFAFYLYTHPVIGKGMLVPFTGNFETGIIINPGILYIPLVFFTVLGTDNGVNFTDGLDGLNASVTIAVIAFFAAVSLKEKFIVSPVCGAFIGSLIGFLIFNKYPARIFMGDTGSLALGGFVAAYALSVQMPLFIVVVGFIYVIEVISVIIQVSYYKKTKGKRFFKMAPIHHHFELSGWSETKIVIVFSIVTVALGCFAYIGFQ